MTIQKMSRAQFQPMNICVAPRGIEQKSVQEGGK